MVTKQLAVLGSPIAHSKSPLIHSAAYGVLGLDWSYDKHEVRKGGLSAFLSDLGPEWLGLSLTMPLKEEAFRLAQVADRAALATMAVNTIVRTDSGWAGFNTDVFGIVQSLHLANLGELTRVLVIGSGATATSAVTAVRQHAPNAKVEIFARNARTRGELVTFAKNLGLKAKAVSNLKKSCTQADLVISTLPAHALDEVATGFAKGKKFNPTGALLDVAYQPWPSELAKVWVEARRPVISGLDMLLWQAVAQIRIFTTGDPAKPLPNEEAVILAMRHALSN